ncbi:MAG: galactokinase [Actinomycetota bacterium]|nr:galactokinase [Actinomycetota bacterium]
MTVSERAEDLRADFEQRTGGEAEGVWAAPGRVNLIGEHTDYNDGFVLPFAIGRQTLAALRRRDDGVARCWSRQQDDPVETALADVSPERRPGGWGAYPLGVAWALAEAGVDVTGFDLLVDSDVPDGAGVSSSAALEGAVALGLAELSGAELSRTGLALAGRRAENEIVGAPTGVMDQMAAMCAREGHALFLDCRSLDARQVPLDLVGAGLCLLVVDTRTKHAHSQSGYGERRRSCERAARALGVAALRDVDLPALEAARGSLDDETFRRARHVVTENERVHRVVELLRGDDFAGVGHLLDQSHASMRDDFEISTAELDLAVHAARDSGAWGARMTGGGFGGSAIALVPVPDLSTVDEAVRRSFAGHRFSAPQTFEVTPSRGAWRAS